MLSNQKPTRNNSSRIEYLKNCVNANLSALNTVKKFGVLSFTDFENRLISVSEHFNLLSSQLNDISKMCGVPSVDTELNRLLRKFGLLHNFFDECLSCISTLRRIDRENNSVFSAGIKQMESFTSKSLMSICGGQALLSNILENGINVQNEFPLLRHLSVMQLTTIPKMKRNPDYAAAKAGDPYAAYRLVNEILKGKDQQSKIRELGQKYPDAIIVGVLAEESAGRNKIPAALIHKISEMTGLEYDRSIVQINKVGRTGSDAIYRLAHRSKFAGDVQAGRKYILTDDVITAGGTLSELRNYIESKGGEVVHLVTAGVAENSINFALSDKTRFALVSKHGIIALKNFVKEFDIYGGKTEYLTESEGKYLLRFKSLDTARNRIAEARYERSVQDIRRT